VILFEGSTCCCLANLTVHAGTCFDVLLCNSKNAGYTAQNVDEEQEVGGGRGGRRLLYLPSRLPYSGGRQPSPASRGASNWYSYLTSLQKDSRRRRRRRSLDTRGARSC
jgi:hypothetical protein